MKLTLMLYVLNDTLSAASGDGARAFLDVARDLLQIAQVTRLETIDNVIDAEPMAGDGVVFVNPPRADIAEEIEALLERAADTGAVVLPIALDHASRRPPGAVGDRQSFDVVDHRRRRNLVADQWRTIAAAFAREALSRLQPTYSKDRLRLFLCHRRKDGEALVAQVCAKLDVLHQEHIFRDLVEVQTGERAQERVDEALATADILVFFDTPKAGESWWIAKELSGALGRNIPVVWVRLGPEAHRAPLPVEPIGAPHQTLLGPQLSDDEARDLADSILQDAFELARAHVRTSQSALRRLKEWAASSDASLEVLDARRLVFELKDGRTVRRYPTRPATDVIQVFARHPTADDHRRLDEFLTSQEMAPHPRNCRSFDAAILLDPTATADRCVGEWSVVEHPERFLATLQAPGSRPTGGAVTPPRLLLLGAFPSGLLSHQEVNNALHAVTTTWLRLGGAIVFGGHPTFTPLILEAARFVVPSVTRDRITVFQSGWFASPAALDGLANEVTAEVIEAGVDRSRSLTAMRVAMIQPNTAAAVLSIGGRTDEGGAHQPGIDEEIRIARAAGLRVHLLGGPGGRTAELAVAAAQSAPPWSALGNTLAPAANELLLSTDNYEQAARLIWEASTR